MRKPTFYGLAQLFVRVVLGALGRISVIDAHLVPRDGPLIVACNHVAYLDPPALGAMSPRPVSYMAKKELFEIPGLGLLIRALHAFPVDRSRGDIAAFKAATAVLDEGACLGIFPEGTRNKNGTVRPQLGVALLAARSGATVVPAFVSGTASRKGFEKITVVFGEPYRFTSDGKASREDLAKWTDELMLKIYALREKLGGD